MSAELAEPDLPVAELGRWKHFHKNLQIADRETLQMIPFAPNVIQQRISNRIDALISDGKPIRFIILKSRRMGVSTIIQMRMFHLATMMNRWVGVTGAHDADTSKTLHAMTEMAWTGLPATLKRPKEKNITGRNLQYEGGGGLSTFTAGTGAGVKRGSGALAIHGSEVAFWDDAAEVMLSVNQTIPEAPMTLIALESTARGMRNFFRDEWVKAVSGKSPYEPLFFGWFEFPDYQMPIPELDTLEGADRVLADLSSPEFWQDYPDGAEDEEEVLRGALGLSREQLYWRRWFIQNKCNSSLDKFHQEYPSTPEEAFLASGSPYFPPALQARLAKMVHDPKGVGDLAGEPIKNGTVRFAAKRFGPLHVFEEPNGDLHVIGADTAGGISEEERAERERNESDYCTYSVINLTHGRTVAEFQKRTDLDLFAEDLARAGWAYQSSQKLPAEIAVEINNGGVLTLAILRDRWFYPRLYHREAPAHEHRGARTHTVGWATTQSNRMAILAGLLEIVRDRPHLLPSRRLLDQIRTFIEISDKRAEHAPGAHDDIIFAEAIGRMIFRMRSYYPAQIDVPTVGPVTVQELEQELLKYTHKTTTKSLREQVLVTRGRRR